MAKTELEQVTEETLNRGGILAELYFDMHSETQEQLQPIMADLVNNGILKAKGVVYCVGSIEAPIKMDNKYSTSAVLTILFKNFDSMVNVIFTFAPVGIDIKRPTGEYSMKINDLQDSMLSIAQISLSYSDYILNKVLTPEELAKVKADLKNRELIGKTLIDKLEKDQAKK